MFNLFNRKKSEPQPVEMKPDFTPVEEKKPVFTPQPIDAHWTLTATTEAPVALPEQEEIAAEPEAIVTNRNDVQVFSSEFGSVRVVMQDNEPWFVATDVCKALEISNNRDAVNRLDEDEKMTVDLTDTHSGKRGGAQSITAVNEPGLYSLVLSSRKPEAKVFKRWITHEVIPSIRKHGAYMTATTIESIISDPASFVKLAQALADEKQKTNALTVQNAKLLTANTQLEWENDGLSQKIEQDAPKVAFTESFVRSNNNIPIAHMAKILQDHGFETGPARFFAQLRKDGFLISEGSEYNLPTYYAMTNLRSPLFTIEKYTYTGRDGKERVGTKVLVTPRGQAYFLKKYCGKNFESDGAKQRGQEILLTRTEAAAVARQKRAELVEEHADVIQSWCKGNPNMETLWRRTDEIINLVALDENMCKKTLGMALRSIGCQAWKVDFGTLFAFPPCDHEIQKTASLWSADTKDSRKKPDANTDENGLLSACAPMSKLEELIRRMFPSV